MARGASTEASHFPTARLSGIHTMLRQTCVKPEMTRARAATCDTSIIRPAIIGPAIGDPHHRPAPVWFIFDVDQRPEWQGPMRGGKFSGSVSSPLAVSSLTDE